MLTFVFMGLSFVQFSIGLGTWFLFNALTFLVPGWGWLRFPLLTHLLTLNIVFLFGSAFEAAHARPWVDPYVHQKTPERVMKETLYQYVIRFGGLGFLWTLEISWQKILFSTLFHSNSFQINDEIVTNPSDIVPVRYYSSACLF